MFQVDIAQPTNDWVMPTFQKLCGHEQLAEVVLHWRRWFSELLGPSAPAARELLAAINPDGLRRLLELAHFASCSCTFRDFLTQQLTDLENP
jgi:hypothetical protein